MKNEIAIIGLGPMGRGMAANFVDHGVSVHALEPLQENQTLPEVVACGAVLHDGLESLVAALSRPRRIMLMIRAGIPVDACLDTLLPMLDEGDIVIDAGNSHPDDTERRQNALLGSGVQMLGIGVSGGPAGARNGPAIMAGGPEDAWVSMQSMFELVAAKKNGTPMVGLMGHGSAGHYVKMVHNAIEYGIMQAIADICEVLNVACAMDWQQIGAALCKADQGPAAGFLLDVSVRAATARIPETAGALIGSIDDVANQTGTGAWFVAEAVARGCAVPVIAAAVNFRSFSADSVMRRAIGHMDGK